ncbi:MAG: hypothetical protein UHD09_01020, partial [Bifidobacterium sp.]|nr:hypothetical protein [Bifidobacterium sp.]
MTGPLEQVEPYGAVLIKMTEILLRENIEQAVRYNRRIAQTNLIDQLLAGRPDRDLVRYLAAELGWDERAPRRVVVGTLQGPAIVGATATAVRDTGSPYAWPFGRLADTLVTAGPDECCLVVPDASCDDVLDQVRGQLAARGMA